MTLLLLFLEIKSSLNPSILIRFLLFTSMTCLKLNEEEKENGVFDVDNCNFDLC